ncbi:MAG: ABC transporter permease [Lachnospiraceae bacterium]|nr:ABC transporter permease [Lachnospiraceae bacterium]
MFRNVFTKVKQYFSYYRIQQKTAFSYIPKLLLCMLCFAALLVGFAFAGSKLLYSNHNSVAKVKIALVTEDDNPLIDLALHYIGKMDSVEGICEFEVTTEEDAFNKLRNGELYSVVLLPPNFIDGIMNGDNIPAEVILHPDSGADSVLFETLASAAAYTLRTAQAGIYAGIDTYQFYELNKKSVNRITNDLNEIYIDMALRRSLMFEPESLSATGTLSIGTFFASSAFILLLLFSGIGCAAFYKSNTSFLSKTIKRQGINYSAQIILQALAISVCYFVIFAIPYLLYSHFILYAELLTTIFIHLPILFILIFGICTFMLLLFRISKNPQTGTLLLFFVSVVLIFLSGGILPKAFLPLAIQKAMPFLPSTHWLSLAFDLFSGSFTGSALILTLLISVLFILLNYISTRLENL